jgi:hypothetical protein
MKKLQLLGIALVGVITLSGASKCEGGDSTPTPTHSRDALDHAQTDELCNYMTTLPFETLLSADGRANASLRASRNGIPDDLRITVQHFYDDEQLNPTLLDPAQREKLNVKRREIIRTCKRYGVTTG